MAENRIEGMDPLWVLIEKEITGYNDDDFSEGKRLATAKEIAASLDETGYNVSKSGGNWLRLKAALKARSRVGRPFMQDLEKSISALTLENITDTYFDAMKIAATLGNDWPSVLSSENRPDFERMVSGKRTDLMVAKAKELGGEEGIRYLIAKEFAQSDIITFLGISEDEYKGVKAKVDAELAEKARVKDLTGKVADKSQDEKIKYLLNNSVADELIIEVGGFDQAAIDNVKKAMEAELAEKKRLEEEAAAKKAAAAAGPSLDQIEPDKMLEYIEGIREILYFSSEEKDIRIMSEQSNIPKALVDIAVSDPDKLDELEAKAGG
ncbi:MAG: hypothetical protein JXL81_01350 [Deltaproteobacteria bacterium]|nr:hypothetical protein [Deltaproteobacteria bacterium]